MQLDEQEIQFKKKARRRLVGAIALVLLMVTILPMVLDDRSTDLPQQEIAISIPSQDGEDFTSDITPYIPEPVVPEEPVPALPEPEDIQVSPAPGPAQSKKEAPAAPAAKPPSSPAVAPKAAAPKPVAAVVSSAKDPTYSVQIGVFSDAANVKQLEDKLKAKGFKSSTEKLQTPQGEKIRLRAGPFATRALAENALSSIKDAGLSGMIITNK
jgi:DedD protein